MTSLSSPQLCVVAGQCAGKKSTHVGVWERQYPGRTDVHLLSLRNVENAHLADPRTSISGLDAERAQIPE